MIENFRGWPGQTCVWPVMWQDSKIVCNWMTDGITDGINWFFGCWYRFTKLKTDQKFIGWAWSKIGVASLVMRL